MQEPLNEISKSLIKIDAKVLELVYKDLAQPSVKKVGKSLSTVLGLGNTVLLPIKLLNEKAKILYQRHMESYKQKLEYVPIEDIKEVEPEIGVPILENLESTTNEKLSELYINLLANSSDKKYAKEVHPRFVRIIENIVPDEARILEYLDKFRNIHETIPFITLRLHINISHLEIEIQNGFVDANEKYTILEDNDTLHLPAKTKEYFENLVGLGLINCETSKLIQENSYDELIKKQEKYIKEQKQLPHITNVTFLKGYFELTKFGKSFIRACKSNRTEE
ncbi:MAG: DUF4393 domain-containing protein [Bacteroidales bacterium]|nr:DUF4393 domain-containing protein [Bacteroidales bacterium]